MGDILAQVLNVVVPVFLCAGVGVVLSLTKVPFDRKILGGVVAKVGYPTLVLSHLSESQVDFSAFVAMIGAATALIGAFVVVGTGILLVLRRPIHAFLAPMTLNNVGNIGLPVTALAFGDAGLAYGLAFLVVVLIGMFTYGQWLPKGTFSIHELVASPVIYAVIIALILLFTETRLPGPIADATKILGGLSIPLMLLILGHTLASLTVRSFRWGAILALAHLAMGAACGFGLAALFGFTGTERGVFIVMAVMPASVATYLFVELFAPDSAKDVASYIVLSTVLSVVALPVVLSLVK